LPERWRRLCNSLENQAKHPNGVRWNNESRTAAAISATSRASYARVKDASPVLLPSLRSAREWQRPFRTEPGLPSDEFLERARNVLIAGIERRAAAGGLLEWQRWAAFIIFLTWDELNIQPGIERRSWTKRLFGVAKKNGEAVVATHILQFCIESIFFKFSW